MNEDKKGAAVETHDAQENQAPQDSTSRGIPASAWESPLSQAREIAYAALRLYEGLKAESWTASYHLEMRLQAFQQRMMDALQPQATFDPQPSADQGGIGALNVSAAESAASSPAEAQERVAAKRAARLAGGKAEPWRGEYDEPAEAFGGEPS